MCLLYTQTQRCPSCKKILSQHTVMYESCADSCSCLSCSSVKAGKNKSNSRYKAYSSEEVNGVPMPTPAAEGTAHTTACPKAELIHGEPQWASRPCGFCRWQHSRRVRQQYMGVHFCMNPFTTDTATRTTVSAPPPPTSTARMERGKGSSSRAPSEVSDLSEGGWSQQSGGGGGGEQQQQHP
ncbi:hypothetical protein PG997_010748 [Apiospora hydei]|uniref:Uncharacterized protein n=1 Tax=Apiospora hydei TaxID=1337664 RepID=A0ABR1VH69_9PEZI